MDATNGDWRVLEAVAPAAPGTAVSAAAERAPATTGWFWWALLALGVIGFLGAAALMLLGSGGGTVEVATELAAIELDASPVARSAGPVPSAELVIDVGGAVARPGVYRLRAGSRVADAIEAAGGFGPTVDAQASARDLNLAAPLSDGDRVRVPVRGEGTGSVPSAASGRSDATGGGGSADGGGLVDLNSATSAELEALPAIGAATAAKIIAAREEQRFASVDDLRTRRLLGESAFAKVRELVTVR